MMRFTIAFAAAALSLGARTAVGAATDPVDAGWISSIPADLLLRRRLDDSTATTSCTDRAADYGTCLSGLADYEACLECVAAYEVPEGASGGSSFDDCGARNTNLCAPYESCPCLDPCLDEISAMYTCYTAAVLPSCTISCGGGGGGGGGSSNGGSTGSNGGSGSGSGAPNSGGAAARRVANVASMGAAVVWGILTH